MVSLTTLLSSLGILSFTPFSELLISDETPIVLFNLISTNKNIHQYKISKPNSGHWFDIA